jgi:hypothetical protein
MQKPWSLYNKEEKLRIDDLKPEHVRIILLAIPTSRMPDWYACQEGDLHWQPISAIPEFYEDVRQIKGKGAEEAPPPPRQDPLATPPQAPRRPLFEDAPEEMLRTEPTLQMEQLSTKERRTARRYTRALNFRINGGAGKIFDCETVDVSMSGLSLERDLPEWVPKSFRAELSLNKTQVKIKCVKVSDTKLKLVDADAWDVIRQWIVNW